MNAFAPFPSRLHWTAQQLADAVPLRLHELFAFDAVRHDASPAANAPHRTSPRGKRYLRATMLPQRFRIL